MMDNIKVGSKVRYFKKVVETETEIPLGSIGILCDISDTVFDMKLGDTLTHYVIFNSITNADWFNINELEYLKDK